jgi:hypothetical protein
MEQGVLTLQTSDVLIWHGSFNQYAFGLIFVIISTGPTLRIASLLYSPTGNLSFVKIAYTKSPSSNSTARLFLLAPSLYFAVDSCNFWIVNLWPSWI